MFIFDEVDKMPNGVLDGVKPYMDHYSHIKGVDYRRAIFIFLRYATVFDSDITCITFFGVIT